MSLVAMAFLWTGSQIPVYIFGKPSQDQSICSTVDHFQVVSLPTSTEILAEQIDGSGLYVLYKFCLKGSGTDL